MANEVKIKITSEANTAGIKTAKRDVEDLGNSVKRVSDDVDKFGKSFDGVDKSIKNVDLKKFSNAGREIGQELGQGAATSLGKTLSGAAPALIPVLGGMAIGAAPLIGATLSSAVIGGAAGLGIIGGIMIAAKDDRVKKAGADLGSNLLGQLQASADPFIEPLLKQFDKITAKARAMGGDFTRIFTNSGKFLDPIVDGATHAIERIVHGIANISDKAGPVVQQIGEGFARVGDVIGDFFDALSQRGTESAFALRTTFGLVASTIDAVAMSIEGLTIAYGFLVKIGAFGAQAQSQYLLMEAGINAAEAAQQKLNKELGTAANIADVVGSATDVIAAGMDAMATATSGSASASAANTRVLHGEVAALSELSEALQAQTDPVFGFIRAQKQMTTAQNAATTAAKKYGENSPQYREALRSSAEAALGLESAAGKVAATSNGKMTPALRATLSAAGLTGRQIDKLAQDFAEAQSAGSRFAKRYDANARVLGAGPALRTLSSLVEEARQFEGTWTATMITRYKQTGKPASGAISDFQGHASGGIVGAGNMQWVGEQGPELVDLPSGSQVRTAGDSMRMMRSAMAGGGGQEGGPPTIVIQSSGSSVDDFIIEVLRRSARTKAGGSVRVLVNQPGVN